MRITRLKVENFKRFQKPLEIEFRNKLTGDIADQFLILGDNGSGKTTLLQAIALKLSPLMWGTEIGELDWAGWTERLAKRDFSIALDLALQEEETERCQEVLEYFDGVYQQEARKKAVGARPTSRLSEKTVQAFRDFLEKQKKINSGISVENDVNGHSLLGMRGHLSRHRDSGELERMGDGEELKIADLPGLFWFDQHRTPANILKPQPNEIIPEYARGNIHQEGLYRTRQRIFTWALEALAGNVQNEWQELQSKFAVIFPRQRIVGPRRFGNDMFLMFADKTGREYELSEMSGGMSQIFPILFGFVQHQINNSVVLVDEVDMHLDPSKEQWMVGMLPTLGQNNQFIMTTHSEAIVDIFSLNQTFSLGAVLV